MITKHAPFVMEVKCHVCQPTATGYGPHQHAPVATATVAHLGFRGLQNISSHPLIIRIIVCLVTSSPIVSLLRQYGVERGFTVLTRFKLTIILSFSYQY
jgi:hypothetical protein